MSDESWKDWRTEYRREVRLNEIRRDWARSDAPARTRPLGRLGYDPDYDNEPNGALGFFKVQSPFFKMALCLSVAVYAAIACEMTNIAHPLTEIGDVIGNFGEGVGDKISVLKQNQPGYYPAKLATIQGDIGLALDANAYPDPNRALAGVISFGKVTGTALTCRDPQGHLQIDRERTATAVDHFKSTLDYKATREYLVKDTANRVLGASFITYDPAAPLRDLNKSLWTGPDQLRAYEGGPPRPLLGAGILKLQYGKPMIAPTGF